MGMAMVQRMGRKAMEMLSDLRLVAGQVKGELETRDVRMQGYLSQVKHLQSGNQGLNLSDYCISLKVETHMLIP